MSTETTTVMNKPTTELRFKIEENAPAGPTNGRVYTKNKEVSTAPAALKKIPGNKKTTKRGSAGISDCCYPMPPTPSESIYKLSHDEVMAACKLELLPDHERIIEGHFPSAGQGSL